MEAVLLESAVDGLLLVVPFARRRCPGVELAVVDGEPDALDRFIEEALLSRLLVGALGAAVVFAAVAATPLSLLMTVGWRCVLFLRMDPPMEPDLESDPVDDVSVVV